MFFNSMILAIRKEMLIQDSKSFDSRSTILTTELRQTATHINPELFLLR